MVRHRPLGCLGTTSQNLVRENGHLMEGPRQSGGISGRNDPTVHPGLKEFQGGPGPIRAYDR